MPSTRDKLLQFHRSHFPGRRSPPLSHPTLGFSSEHTSHDLENNAHDDDVLGHYQDGVERTLTDEQIAIFRHTEIQQLLRERREKGVDSVELARPAARSIPNGEGIDCNDSAMENNEPPERPSKVHREEESEVNTDGPSGDNTRADFSV